METTGIREGDIVKVNVRGQTFHALVAQEAHTDPVLKKRVIRLAPLVPGKTLLTHTVTSLQITDHWRKRRTKGAKANVSSNGE
jgi:hypothetical protein